MFIDDEKKRTGGLNLMLCWLSAEFPLRLFAIVSCLFYFYLDLQYIRISSDLSPHVVLVERFLMFDATFYSPAVMKLLQLCLDLWKLSMILHATFWADHMFPGFIFFLWPANLHFITSAKNKIK